MLTWVVLGLLIGLAAYIRFSPSDISRWHKEVLAETDKDFAGGAVRVRAGELEPLDRIIRADGSKALAGRVEDGLITYVSRSRIIGFPDYTTVQSKGDRLAIYGRLRFGRSDFGVNRARIEGWLAQL